MKNLGFLQKTAALGLSAFLLAAFAFPTYAGSNKTNIDHITLSFDTGNIEIGSSEKRIEVTSGNDNAYTVSNEQAAATNMDGERWKSGITPKFNITIKAEEGFKFDTNALKNSNLAEYRAKYRNVDVLLIDDIQFIGGKDAIQEELFHTFNALYEQKKQIILSSDKPPMELKNLEERLRSRFAWGVAVEIFSPDFETRMAILRSKEERDGKNIDNEVIQFIATNIKSNIRMLEGALNKLYAMSRLNKNQEIDIDLAKSVLKDMITPDAPTKITSEYIATVVADHFNITVAELKAKGRKEPVATARHITVYLCRKMTNDTQTKIGQFLGDRDHSTIVNSEDVITKRITADSELNQTIETIKKKISPQ